MAVDKTTYAMNVKVNDENEIHQFSYSTRWIDISLMVGILNDFIKDSCDKLDTVMLK